VIFREVAIRYSFEFFNFTNEFVKSRTPNPSLTKSTRTANFLTMNGGISPLCSALGQFSGTQVAWPGNCFEQVKNDYKLPYFLCNASRTIRRPNGLI
jgi:hypothetical protein